MKLTKQTLKQIIKEELDKVMNEEELSEAGYTPPQTRGDALGQLEQMADGSLGSIIRQGAGEAGLSNDDLRALATTMFKAPITIDVRTNETIKNIAPKIFTALANGGSNNPAADSKKFMAFIFTRQVQSKSSALKKDKQTLARFFKDKLDMIGQAYWSRMASDAAQAKSDADANQDFFE